VFIKKLPSSHSATLTYPSSANFAGWNGQYVRALNEQWEIPAQVQAQLRDALHCGGNGLVLMRA
jgi:hypothetical protein